jgi:hypothetical protein
MVNILSRRWRTQAVAGKRVAILNENVSHSQSFRKINLPALGPLGLFAACSGSLATIRTFNGVVPRY